MLSRVIDNTVELHPRWRLKHSETLEVVQEGNLLSLESINVSQQPDWLKGTKRSEIISFSKASRYRLIQEVSRYGKLTPIFLTLGYDNPFPTYEDAKYHLDKFWKQIHRAYPKYWGVWKMEFYESGCIHFHILIYVAEGKPFIDKDEVRSRWESATGRCPLYPRIESLRSHRGGIYYATKYLCKEQELLNQEEQKKVGRYWGVLSRKNRVTHKTKFRLSPDEYKYLLGDLTLEIAKKWVKSDLKKKGYSWDDINVLTGTDQFDELAHAFAAKMIKESKAPTHLMTDDNKWLTKIQMVIDAGFRKQEIEKMFKSL